MQYRALGNSGINASVIGLGAWVMGGGTWWGKDPDDRESIATIHAALDAGMNLIDTAPAYGFGRSEEVVGKAIHDRRDNVVLATKCGMWWEDDRGSAFFEMDGRMIRRSLRPETIRIELENSLRRLGTDRIDLYQTHWPSIAPDITPVAESMACLTELKHEGKIRAIGVCNVTTGELEENCSHGAVASDQFRYSMLNRQPEADILPLCKAHNIATLTYMSLEQGLLTGKVGLDRVFQPTEFRSNADWNPWYLPANRKRVLDLLGGWNDLTRQYDCTLAQLVLAWTAAQPGITHVLAGGRTRAQVEENVKAADLILAPADLQRLRRDLEALGEPIKD
jgi:methylglyoxal reductase